MKICYIDEAGDGRRPDQREADVPPVFVICGLVLDSSNLPDLTGGPPGGQSAFPPGGGITSARRQHPQRRPGVSVPPVLGCGYGFARTYFRRAVGAI